MGLKIRLQSVPKTVTNTKVSQVFPLNTSLAILGSGNMTDGLQPKYGCHCCHRKILYHSSLVCMPSSLQNKTEQTHYNFYEAVVLRILKLPFLYYLQVDEALIRSFTDKAPSSVTAQLTLQLTEEHVDGIELTCLATIPKYQGNEVHQSEYADHKAQSVKGEGSNCNTCV